jgi:hypothetical protein
MQYELGPQQGKMVLFLLIGNGRGFGIYIINADIVIVSVEKEAYVTKKE